MTNRKLAHARAMAQEAVDLRRAIVHSWPEDSTDFNGYQIAYAEMLTAEANLKNLWW